MWTIECADVLEWAAFYEGEPFHCILCDPPYHLTSGRGAPGGFMNAAWDGESGGVGIAFRPETWDTLAQHLLPGGFVFAFAGARTYHRLACAMEDAGLRLFPCLGWLFGSGFPKATRIKSNGNEPPEWAGHRYGLQCIKPALELIAVAQKPYQGRPVDSIMEHGAGALWIEGGRINSVVLDSERRTSVPGPGIWGHGSVNPQKEGEQRHNPSGRWPANFALVHNSPHPCPACGGDGCEDCGGTGLVGGCRRVGTKRVKSSVGWTEKDRKYETPDADGFGGRRLGSAPMTYADADGLETIAAYQCEAGCAVREIGEQSGESSSNARRHKGGGIQNHYVGGAVTKAHNPNNASHSDKGTAARFYFNADWHYETAERLAAATPVRYQAKASRKERTCNGTVECNHPTVKPISLCKWLAALLLPPPEYAPRRILVPFAGSGSEMIAAGLAGWEFVLGIEREQEYCTIAEARLAHWLDGPRQLEMDVES